MTDPNKLIKKLTGENYEMDGIAALCAANQQRLRKKKNEMDTEFVKRIARAYNTFAILNWTGAPMGKTDE